MPDEFEPAPALSRREALKLAAASLTLLVSPITAYAATTVLAVRVWPAADYTRITLEYEKPLKYTQSLVKDPWRLVVDLEDVEFNSVLQNLPGKISETDPYIKLIRAGRNKPGVIRLVIEPERRIHRTRPFRRRQRAIGFAGLMRRWR